MLTNSLDDGGSHTQFVQDARTLVYQDKVFAIGVASAWFTPSFFVTTKTPTYGYNVSANWQTRPTSSPWAAPPRSIQRVPDRWPT